MEDELDFINENVLPDDALDVTADFNETEASEDDLDFTENTEAPTERKAFEAFQRMNSRLFNVDLERELLGHIIRTEGDQAEYLTTLKSDHFNDDAHRRIFEMIQQMFTDKNSINEISVDSFFDLKVKQAYLESTRKCYYKIIASSLTDTLFNTVSQIREMHKNRLIYHQILQEGGRMFDDNTPTDQIIEHMTNALVNVETGKPEKKIAQVTDNVVDSILDPQDSEKGLTTDILELDMAFGGIKPDTYTTIGIVSGGGKTAALIDIFERVCTKYPDDIKILFFSMEMSEERVIKRMISRKTDLTVTQMEGRISDLSPADREKVRVAGKAIRQYPMEIVYQTMTCNGIKLRARKFAMQNPGKRLIIAADHIGLVAGATNDMRVNTINASSAFKSLCVDYGASLFVLTQFTKEVEGKDNRSTYYRPHMRYIMESGRVRQDSDIVMLGWRPEMYFKSIPYGPPVDDDGNQAEWETKGKMIWLIEKNRDGAANFDIILDCDIATNKFSNPKAIF